MKLAAAPISATDVAAQPFWPNPLGVRTYSIRPLRWEIRIVMSLGDVGTHVCG